MMHISQIREMRKRQREKLRNNIPVRYMLKKSGYALDCPYPLVIVYYNCTNASSNCSKHVNILFTVG